MKKLTLSQKIIIKIIGDLKHTIEGRKKLMKLMFLMQHYDLKENKLVKEGILDNEFIIYHYGVFSFDVMNDYIKLINDKILKESPIGIIETKDIDIELDDETKNKVKIILEKFGKKHGFELEVDTLKMLGMSKETKREFFGKKVIEFIK